MTIIYITYKLGLPISVGRRTPMSLLYQILCTNNMFFTILLNRSNGIITDIVRDHKDSANIPTNMILLQQLLPDLAL